MMKLGSLLKNKYLCWAVMALSALTILGYVSSRAWECLVLFVAVAYGVNTFVHENTTVALLSALFAANFLFGCGRVKENATGSMDRTVQKLEEQANDMEKKCEEGQTYDEEQKKCVDNVKDAVSDLQAALDEAKEKDVPM